MPPPQAAHCRSAEAVQPSTCWPAPQAVAVQALAQAASSESAGVEAVGEAEKVPPAQAAHARSAVAVAAAL